MKKQDRFDWLLAGIIFIGLVFFVFAAPAVTAWGVVTGRLDIQTLEPIGPGKQVQEEFGGY